MSQENQKQANSQMGSDMPVNQAVNIVGTPNSNTDATIATLTSIIIILVQQMTAQANQLENLARAQANQFENLARAQEERFENQARAQEERFENLTQQITAQGQQITAQGQRIAYLTQQFAERNSVSSRVRDQIYPR